MKRMLINATQAEERRLAIVDGQNSSTTKLRLTGANSAKATFTRQLSPALNPP